MSYCLPSKESKKLLAGIADGSFSPEKYAEQISTEARRAYLEKFVSASEVEGVNTLMESKMLLKDWQRGMVTAVKKLTGLSEPAKRDLVSRVTKMDKLLSPADEKSFYADITAQRLGAKVDIGEAKKITDLSKKIQEAKQSIPEDSPYGSPERMAYGRPLVEMQNYVNDLIVKTRKITLADIKKQPIESALKGVSDFGGLVKSLKASLDLSAIGRQGRKLMATNPIIWLKNSAQSFVDVVHTFGGRAVLDEVKAEVLSRPNALNGLYAKEKLAVGVIEEAYPTSLPERVPYLGRVFKASQEAFTAFQYRNRADVFDRYVEIAEKTGADITGIGKVVNSLTGRGTFGQKWEGVATNLNNIFFSPRFLKSNVDLLLAHYTDSGIGSFARKQAALNLLKVVGSVAVVFSIARAIDPDSVELDPRSADFGKIKVGNTRFDVSGGMASIVTLAARLAMQSSKSSTSGKITKIDDPKAYKGATTLSTLGDYFTNKTAPFPSFLISLRLGEDRFTKKPINLTSVEGGIGVAKTLFAPIGYTNYEELRDNPNSAPVLSSMIFDGLGFGTNTYGN